MTILVDSVVALPKRLVDADHVRHDLTVRYFRLGETEPEYVEAFSEDKAYLYVPRHYGLQLIAKLGEDIEDCMSRGAKAKFPHNVQHTGDYAYQHEVVEEILRVAETHNDFIVEAATGKGKTVMSLSVAQKLGRATLVVVDQENLMDQWVQQCRDVLKLPDSRIGRIQGDTCDYEGKSVVIAMVHSLVQRDYEDAMYDYFGTVIFDEVHGMGAPTFSEALRLFSAVVRFGVSATVDRSDALQKLLHWNLGNIAVSLTDKHDKSYLYYIESDTVYSWYANISPKAGRMLLEVSEDTTRNEKLVGVIQWMYAEGRDTLVISDRIEQLEALMSMAYYAGVPKEAMGLYTGMRTVWQYSKNPTPKQKPYGLEAGADYTPIEMVPKRKKIPKAELARVKSEARLLFATYGMFSKGVDVPRLSGGLDCTPRSKAGQTHGRILRKRDGKLVPIWVTVRDTCSYRLEFQFLQRLTDYIEDSAEIYKWRMDKGVRLEDVRELKKKVRQRVVNLKGMNIVTEEDKSCTLQTPATPAELRKPPATRTAKTTRYRGAD